MGQLSFFPKSPVYIAKSFQKLYFYAKYLKLNSNVPNLELQSSLKI